MSRAIRRRLKETLLGLAMISALVLFNHLINDFRGWHEFSMGLIVLVSLAWLFILETREDEEAD